MYREDEGSPPKIIKPAGKGKVINLVESCGIDVSQWGFRKDGLPIRTAPSTNPHYCYGWTFTNEIVTVCCLWWEEMREDANGVYARLPILENQKILPPGVRKRHTDDLAEALLSAYDRQSPVNVLVVDGDRKNLDRTSEASRVNFRQKDPSFWYVTKVDHADGWILLRRGGRFIDGIWNSARVLADSQTFDDASIAQDWAEIDEMEISYTERIELKKARVGQGEFRNALILRWNGKCALTGISLTQVLKASHCVPWSKSKGTERVSPKNGILLSATIDAMFDAGLITFSEDGDLLAAASAEKELDQITKLRKLRLPLDDQEKEFMRRHMDSEFDKIRRFSPRGFDS